MSKYLRNVISKEYSISNNLLISDGTASGSTNKGFVLNPGTVSIPSLSFINETNTGIYNSSNNNFDIGILGANVINFQASSTYINNLFNINSLSDTNTSACLTIGGAADTANTSCIRCRAGNDDLNYNSSQIFLSFNNSKNYTHAIKSRHLVDDNSGNGIDFYIWDRTIDSATAIGTKFNSTFTNGKVGVGIQKPLETVHVKGSGVSISNSAVGGDYRWILRNSGASAGGTTDSNLKDFYTFNNTGNLGLDSYAGGNVTNLTNSGVTSTASVNDGSITLTNVATFDASGDTLNSTSPGSTFTSAVNSSSFSIAWWVYFTSTGTARHMWAIPYGAGSIVSNGGISCYQENPGTNVHIYVGNSSAVNYLEFQEPSAAVANVWYHYAITFSASGTKMYRNGSEITPSFLDGTASTAYQPAVATKLYLGGSSGVGIFGSTCFSGHYNDFLFSNTNWSASQVLAIYNMNRNMGSTLIISEDDIENLYFTKVIAGALTDYGFVEDDAINGAGNDEINFTGQHRCRYENDELSQEDIDLYLGRIVYATGVYKTQFSKDEIKEGKEGIFINETIPVIKLCTTLRDNRVFGVISNIEDENNPNDRIVRIGCFSSIWKKPDNDKRVWVNSIGEGAIWVCNSAGNLEIGDYIECSGIMGFGQKQNEDYVCSYTVAKITCNCDFSDPEFYNIKYINLVGETITNEQYITSGGYICAFVGCTYHCG